MTIAERGEMNFVITLRGTRQSVSISTKTVAEAIAEAERLAPSGTVRIFDPYETEYSQEQFEELRRRWQGRER